MDKVKQLREPFPWMEHAASLQHTPNKLGNPKYKPIGYGQEIVVEDEEVRANPLVKAANSVTGPEKMVARGFEKLSDNIVHGFGIRYTPWTKVMHIFNTIYAILTILICFYRTDFVNLTV